MTSSSSHQATLGGQWAQARAVLWAVRVTASLSVFSLGLLLVMIAISVVARYVFGAPLLGSNEVLQLALVAMVTLALLPSAHGEHHIRVDVLDAYIGKWGRFAGDLISRVISAFVLFSLSYRATSQALDALEFGDATNMLAIPLWPFYTLIVLGAFLHATVLLIQIVDVWRRGVNENV